MTATIAIASDHAGTELKSQLKEELSKLGFAVKDLGTDSTASVDYPDYADRVAHSILNKEADKGVLICGSGIGMSMAANRHKGIRAALCHEGLSAELSRRHNDANIVVLGARITGSELAKEIVKRFLTTEFEGGRHQTRVDKMG